MTIINNADFGRKIILIQDFKVSSIKDVQMNGEGKGHQKWTGHWHGGIEND